MAKGKQEFDLVPLITKVKENPILYDKNHEDYADAIHTNRAWNGIARELLLPNGEVVRCKWKSTCEIYLKNLKGSKKTAAVKWPWAEHMKFFEPYLTDGKTVGEQNKDPDTSTPSKKTVSTKRQRSPVEVAASRRFSRSVATVEEELGEVDSPIKKARISVLEKTVERKVTSNKGTPRKSQVTKTSSQRLPRSSSRVLESEVSIIEDDSEGSTSAENETIRKPSNKNINLSPSKNSSKVIPIGISPEMKKGPRRLPRSVLRALEAEAETQASSTIEHSEQTCSSPSVSRLQSGRANTSLFNKTVEASPSVTIGSRSTKRSQRRSLDPNLTSSVHSPLRSARYSSIPEKPSSNEDLLENPISSARFSTSHAAVTGATPSSFRDSLGYFESINRESKRNDSEMISKNRLFSSPARHSVSFLTSSSCRLPRSTALEEEFARHDAMLGNSVILETSEDDDSFNEGNTSKRVPITAATKETMDATDLLFLSHALTIKSFSERKQMEVKRRVAQIITQAEIEEVS